MNQLRDVLVLADLLTRGLPRCQWIVFGELGLEGWITGSADPYFDIALWSRVLGDAPVTHDGRSRVLFVTGRFHGTDVSIRVKTLKGSPDVETDSRSAEATVATETGRPGHPNAVRPATPVLNLSPITDPHFPIPDDLNGNGHAHY
jgi:hypothetical protein